MKTRVVCIVSQCLLSQLLHKGICSIGQTAGIALLLCLPPLPAIGAGTQVIAWGDNSYRETSISTNWTNLVSIAAGDGYSLALRDDGTVVAWGDNYYHQTEVPSGLGNVVAVAAGAAHSLALRDDGTVVAWGLNGDGQASVPTDLNNVVAVAAGGWNSLALRADGAVVVWGFDYFGLEPPLDLTNAVAVATGQSHSLALLSDGHVVAWGDNSSGQTAVPSGLANVVAIAAGSIHSLALKRDGSVVAWGDNSYGQTAVPPSVTKAIAVAAGTDHSLALRADGTVIGWGYNLQGQTAVPASLTNATAVAGGYLHSLALAGGQAPFLTTPLLDQSAPIGSTLQLIASAAGTGPFSYQWRFNGGDVPGATDAVLRLTNLQPADAGSFSVVVSNSFGTTTSSPARLNVVPLLIATPPQAQTTFAGGSVRFSTVAKGLPPLRYLWHFKGSDLLAATSNTLVLTNVEFNQAGPYSVTVSNDYGGALSSEALLTVVPLVLTELPRSVDAFRWATVKFDVVAQGVGPFSYQWHFNGGDIPGATSSMLVLPSVQFDRAGAYSVTVANSYGSVLSPEARLRVSEVAAWGANANGFSAALPELTNVVAIAAGRAHSLALTSDGRVVAWGDTAGLTNMPLPLTNVLAVAAGGGHSLALKGNGTVAAWGRNDYGQAMVPLGLTNAVAIAAGGAHNLALREDGRVVAWGDNSAGQTDVPSDLTNVVAISGADYYSLALKADGTVVAWGANGALDGVVPQLMSGVVAIAAGQSILALTQDGTLIFWGTLGPVFFWGPTGGAQDLTNIVAIAEGCCDINLVLHADGTVGYWYDAKYFIDPGAPPPGITNATAISTKGWPGDGLALIGDSPPVLSVPVLNLAATQGTFSFSVPTRSGRVYSVEFKNSLDDTNWTLALPLLAGNGRIRTLTNEITTATQRFYRVRQW